MAQLSVPVESTDHMRDRCVLIVDAELPRWLIANTTAVLGVAIGAHGRIPLGPNLRDHLDSHHPGIGMMPLPILAASAEELPSLRQKALGMDIFVIDFNTAALESHTYTEYEQRLLCGKVGYLGLALHGSAKALSSLTGNLRSLR